MQEKINQFKLYIKSIGNRVDFDWGAFWFQCNDLTRAWLHYVWLPQYARLWSKWVIYIAWNPNAYLPKPLRWVKNDPKDKYQVPKPWDIVILNRPSVTGHIAIVENVYPWQNRIDIFEQNWGNWNWNWLWSNACRTRSITYVNVMWWITR